MTGTSVLSQAHLLLTAKEPTQSPEVTSSLKDQECVSLFKKYKSVRELKQIRAQIFKLGLFWDSFCVGNLVATCTLSDWGSMDYACSIFRRLEEPGTFLFNTMIRGYVKDGNWGRALAALYRDMLESGVEPDNFTYPAILKACAKLSALEEGKRIHGHSVKLGLQGDVFVQNSLVNMYGKCGDLELACAIFDRMSQKSVASWSAIIGAHAGLGKWLDCLTLFGI